MLTTDFSIYISAYYCCIWCILHCCCYLYILSCRM